MIHVAKVAQTAEITEQLRRDLERHMVLDIAILGDRCVLRPRDPRLLLGNLRTIPRCEVRRDFAYVLPLPQYTQRS